MKIYKKKTLFYLIKNVDYLFLKQHSNKEISFLADSTVFTGGGVTYNFSKNLG